MKKLCLIVIAISLFACSADLEKPENTTTVANLFAQLSDSNSLEVREDFYEGIIGTFDQSIHGRIIISRNEKGQFTAGARTLSGTEHRFIGSQNSKDTYLFKGAIGSFEIEFGTTHEIKAFNVNFNDKDGFVSVFENSRGGSMILAQGTYVDSSDPTFSGVFDMLNYTGEIDPVVPPFGPAFRIQDVFISHISGQTSLDANALNYEGFTQCTFAVLPITMRFSSSDIEVVDAHNQTSNFFSYDCTWDVFYGNNAGSIVYKNFMCDDSVSSGTWSWNGRSGTLTILDVL